MLLGIGMLAFSALAASFSLRQPLVVAVDVGLSSTRLLGALFALFWVQEIFFRDIDRKSISLFLAYPVPISSYVVGRYLGVLLLAGLAVVVWGAGVYGLGRFADWGNELSSAPVLGWRFLATLAGVWLDLAVIAAFVLMVSSVATTTMLPFLAGVVFVLTARSIGPVSDYLAYSGDADPVVAGRYLPILDAVRFVLPDLARLDWRASVLYAAPLEAGQAAAAVVSAIAYCVALLTVSVRVYARRDFFEH